jgi:prepilin-type N-terminal cleavage/methylation domain-containing protein
VLVKRLNRMRDERGMTLVELLVAMSAGAVVMLGVTMTMIVTMRETNRVASHVEANQNARITMTKIMNQLHSACVAPQIAPIQEGSTPTLLSFLHQSGSAVAPVPVLSKISLTGTTLSQADYPVIGGAAPKWTFSSTASTTTQLMTGVSPISASIPLFSYHAYSNGAISETPLATPLSANAATAVQVKVAYKAGPDRTISGDTNAETSIQNAALLRLTPPAYSNATANLPCQ